MLERHHIIYKSQGGLDFELNYVYLTANEHRGENSPHKCKEIDLLYKQALEEELRELLVSESYFIDELIQLLGLDTKQAQKAFNKVEKTSEGVDKENIIFRLMGNRFYL